MNKEVPISSRLPKCEMFEKLVLHYPAVDVSAMELISYIKEVAKSMSALLTRDLAAHDLSEARFYVLAELFVTSLGDQGELTPSDLAESLGVTRATITSLLDGLAESEYIVRTHDMHDRRAVTIHLTEKGRKFMDNFLSSQPLTIGKAVGFIPEEDRKTMVCKLAEINAAFQKRLDE